MRPRQAECTVRKMKSLWFQRDAPEDPPCRTRQRCLHRWRAIRALGVVCVACATTSGPVVRTAASPSADERYCAWFGDEDAGVLYFGEAPFWSAHRASSGSPVADPAVTGPQEIGRFDLAREVMLPPLPVASAGERSGTWDVLVQGGRVYFTSLYDRAGYVEIATGRVQRLGPESQGLNELAPGPEGRVFATRYFDEALGAGSVVVLDAEGSIEAELPLAGPPGTRPAAKSIAWDPARDEIWVNTDLFLDAGSGVGHDVRILDRTGRELLRFEDPEVQFMVFAPDGTGWLAERSGKAFALRHLGPDEVRRPPVGGTRIAVDDRFPPSLDFVQEVTIAPDGSALATRWGGWLHRVWPDGTLVSQRLPEPASGGLYYTGVVHGNRVCATLCADVNVVCEPSR